MIYANGKIMWLDIDTGNFETNTVGSLFGQYYLRLNKDLSTIEFNIPGEHRIKLTDRRGWSDLLFIKRIMITNWHSIETSLGKSTLCSSDQLIPVYNSMISTRGFHGETKYQYRLIPAIELNAGNTLRIRHAIDHNNISTEFDYVISSKPIELNSIGYEIITKSGFYNCDDIYMWGGDIKLFTPCGLVSDCEGFIDPLKCTGCR